jgi:hypothetical protein
LDTWRQQFLGREADMQRLQEAWRRAREKRPQFLVLLAESGFGKTRLVQEFYGWLSTTFDDRDPGGYWPDALPQIGDSMEINPVYAHGGGVAEGAPEIPWLWWGIRCTRPDDRRSDASVSVALTRYVPVLEPHIAPILLKRQRRQITRKAAFALGAILIHLTPVQVLASLANLGEIAELVRTGVLVTKEALETFLSGREAQEARERERAGIAERAAEHRQSLADLALEAIAAILDPGAKDAPTAPVIVVLDDAQWADTETLRFVEKLVARAHLRAWPLLLIATHWEREWNERCRAALPEGDETLSLADVYRRQEVRFPDCPPRVLGKVPDLAPMLEEALPGLTPEQAATVLRRVDGNPLLLVEFVRYLQRNTHLFAGRSPAGPLTAAGQKQIAAMQVTLPGLARDRFDSLTERFKDVLGWSSYQGMRFLRAVTRAVASAEKVRPHYTAGDVDRALRDSEYPLALIQNEQTSGRSEFRQVAFHEVARAYLNESGSKAAVRAAIRKVLAAWLSDGSIETLPHAERMDALQIAANELKAGTDSWARALLLLLRDHRSNYAWGPALAVARLLADAAPSAGWPLDALSFWDQVEALDLLRAMRVLERARRLSASLCDAARTHYDATRSPESLRDLWVSLLKMADVERALGKREEALARYEEGLEIRRRIAQEYGATPESLRDMACSLFRIADCTADMDPPRARDAARDTVELFRTVLRHYGETPQAREDLLLAEALCARLKCADNG